jgi:4a-hydroxytetrahydrobiopterin dehydratase
MLDDMSDLAYVKLSDDDVAARLKSLDGWKVEGGLLKKEFSFKTYKDGVVFASAVAFVADKLDHHPDIALGYQKVGIAVNTHSVGGISPYDFELARRIDAL